MNQDPHNRPYKVGKGRPPKEHQIKPGERRNPKGRPKGSLNVATVVKRTASAKVTILVGGRKKSVTVLEALTKQLFNQAISGNSRAIQLCLALLQQIEGTEAVQNSEIDAASRNKAKADLLASLKVRLKQFMPEESDDDSET
jgi:hypothetical protein